MAPAPATRPRVHEGILLLPEAICLGDAAARVVLFEVIAAAYLDGVRRALCFSEAGAAALRDFNALLTTRGAEPVTLREAAPGGRAASRFAALEEEEARLSRRREFMRKVAPPAEVDGTALAGLQQHEGAGAPLYAAVPVIDPTRCTGCDACLRVCPEDVLTHINEDAGPSCYKVDAGACDACGLCERVCDMSAIEVETMIPTPADVALRAWRCAACGVSVHAPALHPEADGGLCPPCRRAQHHKKLFQVLT